MYCRTSRASEASLGEFKAAGRQFLRQGWQMVQEDISQIASGNQEMHPARNCAEGYCRYTAASCSIWIISGNKCIKMYKDWFDILKKHVKKCDFTGTGFSQKKLLSSCCQIDRIWSNKYVAHCSTTMNSDSAEGHGRNLRVPA